MKSKLDSALELAADGFHVFPLAPDSKKPVLKDQDWKQLATRDEARIRQWWSDMPDCNIGISTSVFGDDKALLVVDIDKKDGRDGYQELVKLELDGKEIPETLEQDTPSGGRHLIYVVDQPVRQGANVLGSGLDIRSFGGYIVGPGSTIDGRPYHLRSGRRAPCVAPPWIVESRRARSADKDRQPAPRVENLDIGRARIRAAEYLRSLPPAVAGGRNDAAFKTAAALKDYGLDRPDCLELMRSDWKCEPMLDDGELEAAVRSAYKYGSSQQGSAAPEAQFTKVDPPKDDTNRHPFQILNDDHAFVLAGGGHHILWETTDAHGRYALEHLSESAFHKKHAAWRMQVGRANKPVTDLWMDDPSRRSFDGICFMPGLKAPDRFYNLWRGFAYQPLEPNEEPRADWQAAVDAFIEHAYQNVCMGSRPLFRWLMGYFAHLVQRPWEKPLVALVFRGSKGVGKNALIDRIGDLLGPHFLLTSNRRYLIGNFNGHLENLLLFVLDEAFWSGDKPAEGTLKDLITGRQHVVEHKGKEPYTVDNRTRIVIIGNEDWLAPATHDERRFAVFDVGEGRKQDRKFFNDMRVGMEAGGYRLLLRYLLDYDISELDFNQAPLTNALLDQKLLTMEPFYQWWYDCLSDGHLVGGDYENDWPKQADTERFRKAFARYSHGRNIKARAPDSRAVGRMLVKCAGVEKARVRDHGHLGYVYVLPPLDEARRRWEKFIGHAVGWDQ